MDAKSKEIDLWALKYPELGTGPVSIESALTQEQFGLERDRIFKKMWLHACRVEEIPNAGDYIVKDIDMCNASIILIRNKEGAVRAFHNVCRHRSNKVLWDDAGNCRAMTCKFHGWAYKLDGSLADVPDEDRFFDFKKEDHSLVPVAVDVWEGFIFINLDPEPKESLLEYLGEIAEELQGFPFDDLTTVFTYETEVNCNWKVVVDAFQEGYHVAHVHGKSLPDYSRNPELGHPQDLKLYARHASFQQQAPAPEDHQITPSEGLAFQYGVQISGAISQVTTDELEVQEKKSWGFMGNRMFPNFFIAVLDGMYFTHEMLPLSTGQTFYRHKMYFPKARMLSEHFSQEASKCVLRDAVLEDMSTLEHTQKGMEAGKLKAFMLQDDEILVRQFYRLIENYTS